MLKILILVEMKVVHDDKPVNDYECLMGCQYANDLSVNNDFGCNCVNSGYLPDDGPSGRTG